MRRSSGMIKRTSPASARWRDQVVMRRPASLRAARAAGALLVVAWAVVQYEGRRPRPPEAEMAVPPPPPEPPLPGGFEIERKFLVRELPLSLQSYPQHEIEHGYLPTDEDVELRVRRSGGATVRLMRKARFVESSHG